MAISNVSSYTSIYESLYASKQTTTSTTGENKEKSVLDQMQNKYSSIEITSGTFSQSQISSKNKGFQGVMISSAFLSKAENDDKTAKDLDEMLSGVETAYNWLKNALAGDGLELVSCGYYIDDQGNMGSYSVVKKKDSMFDELQKQTDDMNNRIKEKREKKAQEKKLEEEREIKLQEEKKKEERNVKMEDNKQKIEEQRTGNHVDYSI